MKISVDLGERSYEVVVGEGVRTQLASLIALRAPRAERVAIVTSSSLRAQPWFDFEVGLATSILELPDGEQAKRPEHYVALVEALAERSLSRHDVVVGVRGGAITDVAGFAAATYLRGVPVIHVATTVAGQVDAAIGGKTGVNLRTGKNLLGAFHQPLGVLCDLATLHTLPERERRAGMGEVVKCALLEAQSSAWLARSSFESQMELAIALKARLVASDEREGSSRALLNYGHTLAHALEREAMVRSDVSLRHGEAVAIGLAFAARLARAVGRLDDRGVAEHDAALNIFQLPTRVPSVFDSSALLEAMSHDKKAHHDLTFVLAGAEGFSVVSGLAPDVVRTALDQFRGES